MHSVPQLEILFDVDGVLIYPALRFRDYLERNHGITPEMTAAFFRGRFHQCTIGQAELKNELPFYLQSWGWRESVGEFIDTWLREDGTPDPGIMELVANLRSRGFKCHVVSVQERNRASYLRQTLGFAEAFDKTFFSCDLGVTKPDQAFYARVQDYLGKYPRDLLLVDDSPACIEAAGRAGWHSFHYRGPGDSERLAAEISGLVSS